MARKTKEDAEKTRQAIMASALDMIARNGLAQTSLDAIAKNAGVTRGAVYWHFANKADLFRSILEDWIAPSEQLAADYLLDAPPSLDNLKAYMVAWLSHIETVPQVKRLFDIVFFKVEQVGPAKRLIDELNSKATQDLQALQLYLNELREKGELSPTVDLGLAATSISAFLMGHAQIWLARPDHYSLSDNAEPLVEQFFHGFAPDASTTRNPQQ